MRVTCTLTSADLARQRERWHDLAAKALIERVETERGLRILFRAAPGVEDELRTLVAVENDCCAWADWVVEVTRDEVALDVHSTGDGVATLHGMVSS